MRRGRRHRRAAGQRKHQQEKGPVHPRIVIPAKAGIQFFLFWGCILPNVKPFRRISGRMKSNGPDKVVKPVDEGHQLRSRLIDRLAHAENFLNGLLQDQTSETGKTKPQKIPHLLGLKLEKARSLTKAVPERFRSPERADRLLEQMKPFVELRSKLAHSVLTVAESESGATLFVFDGSSAVRGSDWTTRVAIREDEFRKIVGDLSGLINQLKQQTC